MTSDSDGRRPIRRALISVYDKSGLADLARGLHDAGVAIVSTGSTAKTIAAGGVPVTAVEDVTGFPEVLDGRVKTLHPRVHAGLLADTRKPEHLAALEQLGVAAFELVVVNLYPFSETVESLQRGEMFRLAGVGQQARMHPRVQRLDPAVEHLGEAGQVFHPGDRNAGGRDGRGRRAGRHDLHAAGVQGGRELRQPGLVVNADQGTPQRPPRVVVHRITSVDTPSVGAGSKRRPRVGVPPRTRKTDALVCE